MIDKSLANRVNSHSESQLNNTIFSVRIILIEGILGFYSYGTFKFGYILMTRNSSSVLSTLIRPGLFGNHNNSKAAAAGNKH